MAGKGKRLDSDMTQGSIWRQLIEFAIPMIFGLIFQQLYNTVDTIVVGQFVGKEALAAVGTTSSIINTLVGFAAGLSPGPAWSSPSATAAMTTRDCIMPCIRRSASPSCWGRRLRL